jgi:hypothetical protein
MLRRFLIMSNRMWSTTLMTGAWEPLLARNKFSLGQWIFGKRSRLVNRLEGKLRNGGRSLNH